MTSAVRQLLAAWEAAACVSPEDRCDALLGLFDSSRATSLGARNAELLSLRARLFGHNQQLRANCPECTAIADFAIDCEAMRQAALPAHDAGQSHRLTSGAYRIEFRLPGAEDLKAASRSEKPFEGALLAHCVTSSSRGASPCPLDDLPDAVLDELSERMEELEPGASISFDLSCPECGCSWTAPMDVGDVLWTEIQAHAERLLLDVDKLARAYGWSEESLIALTPTRRAAYLQLVGAAS